MQVFVLAIPFQSSEMCTKKAIKTSFTFTWIKYADDVFDFRTVFRDPTGVQTGVL